MLHDSVDRPPINISSSRDLPMRQTAAGDLLLQLLDAGIFFHGFLAGGGLVVAADQKSFQPVAPEDLLVTQGEAIRVAAD